MMPPPHHERHLRLRNTEHGWSGGASGFIGQACLPGFQRASGSFPKARERSRKSAFWSRVSGRECPDRDSNRRTVGQGFHKGQERPFGQVNGRNAPCRKGDATGESGAVSPLAKRVGDAGADVRSASDAVLQTHGLPLTKNRLYVVGIWGCDLPVIARYASTDLTLERRS